MCVPSPFRSNVTRYVAAVVSTASICPVNNPSCAPRRRALEQHTKKEPLYLFYSHSQSNYLMCVCVPSLPVTFVPMLSLRGISSGRSLQFDTSEIFPCCSKRIFCLFCRKAVRSSTKNAEEHLDGTRNHDTIFTIWTEMWISTYWTLIRQHTVEASPSASWLFPIQLWSTFLFSGWEKTPWGTGRIHCLLQKEACRCLNRTIRRCTICEL